MTQKSKWGRWIVAFLISTCDVTKLTEWELYFTKVGVIWCENLKLFPFSACIISPLIPGSGCRGIRFARHTAFVHSGVKKEYFLIKERFYESAVHLPDLQLGAASGRDAAFSSSFQTSHGPLTFRKEFRFPCYCSDFTAYYDTHLQNVLYVSLSLLS